MKIGLSLSRCVVDIYNGDVDIDDVIVIVSRTNVDPTNNDHWSSIWHGYTGNQFGTRKDWVPYADHEEEFKQIVLDLHNTGKLHQPRQYGGYPPRVEYHWLETFAPEEDVEKNPAVKKAWEKYKILAGLS